MDIQHLYNCYLKHPLVCTDTRRIAADCIFFALKGEHFNGNTFAQEALRIGAAYVVIDEPEFAIDERCIIVDDVLTALQQLATHHRKQLGIPVIGITGSNGKTTTKELTSAVLASSYQTFATQGNLNNHIGVPISVLAIHSNIEIAIVEMGANHIGEIAALCQIAQPTHGLITNIGKAHLEGFGSFEGVKQAKSELYDYLASTGGTVFLQGDNQLLQALVSQRSIQSVETYGFSAEQQVFGKLIATDPFLALEWQANHEQVAHQVFTQLTGSYNTENVMAAIRVGLFFGVSPEVVNEAVANYRPENNRSQISDTARQNRLIRDYYNANVSSMAAAVANVQQMDAKHKVLILGDMFELGAASQEEHARLVELALAVGADRTIFVGKAFYACKQLSGEFYTSTSDAHQALIENPVNGSLVLLKASRGMAFETLLDVL